jgi:DnaJ-class molecular chaperone
MIHHPDKNGNSQESTEKFQKISEAYEVLGTPEKKKEYDMTQNNPFFKMMSQQGLNPNMNPVDELFSSIFGMPFMSGAGLEPRVWSKFWIPASAKASTNNNEHKCANRQDLDRHYDSGRY